MKLNPEIGLAAKRRKKRKEGLVVEFVGKSGNAGLQPASFFATSFSWWMPLKLTFQPASAGLFLSKGEARQVKTFRTWTLSQRFLE